MKRKYWRVWELRSALVDGTSASMGIGMLAFMALTGTAMLLALSVPVWFLGRCVFAEVWQPGLACELYPPFDPGGWVTYTLALVSISSAYVFLYWASQRYGFVIRQGSVTMRPTTVLALVAGLLLGGIWARTISGPGDVSSFATLVWWFTTPALVWLLRVHFVGWATVRARWWTSKEQSVEHIVRMLVYRYLRLGSPNLLDVRCGDGRVHVKGPFDAIDARRIEDIVLTRFSDTFVVEVETTLDEDAYWAIYRSQLAPSGYVSKPLTPPRNVPAIVVVGLVLCGVILVTIAFRYGPGLGPGITAEDLAGFFGVTEP